jgi:3-oxoacyl-[acyl-carrier protein] reductase
VVLGRAVLAGMVANRSGRIVQVDSEVVDGPAPGRTAYATAKSAQIGLTRSWARELAPLGITVNTVAPGSGAGTREDVAHAVSFVASAAASFLTGQRIVVDGGRALGVTP